MDVPLHNASGPYEGLPRTVGWGYPETLHPGSPISSLGIFASGNEELFHLLRTLPAAAYAAFAVGSLHRNVERRHERNAS